MEHPLATTSAALTYLFSQFHIHSPPFLSRSSHFTPPYTFLFLFQRHLFSLKGDSLSIFTQSPYNFPFFHHVVIDIFGTGVYGYARKESDHDHDGTGRNHTRRIIIREEIISCLSPSILFLSFFEAYHARHPIKYHIFHPPFFIELHHCVHTTLFFLSFKIHPPASTHFVTL
jgi:hypothetical protein